MRTRLDLLCIAVITLAALVGVIVLAATGKPIPDALPMVVTAGLGALGMSAAPLGRVSGGGPDNAGQDRSTPDGPDIDPAAAGLARHLTRTDTGEALHTPPSPTSPTSRRRLPDVA